MPACVSCGLSVDDAGRLNVQGPIDGFDEATYFTPGYTNTGGANRGAGVVPLDCTDHAEGAPVLCTPDAGLITLPPTRTAWFRNGASPDPTGDTVLGPGNSAILDTHTFDIVNSACRDGVVMAAWAWSVRLDSTDAAQALVDYRFTRHHGTFTQLAPMEQLFPGNTTDLHATMERQEAFGIPAGGTITLRADTEILNRGPGVVDLQRLDVYMTGVIIS